MKVLWLSSANTLFKEKGDRAYNGKGWISSLQDTVCGLCPDISLAVAFLSDSGSGHVVKDGVSFYKLHRERPKGIRKLLHNWTGAFTENYDDDIRRTVCDFKPDLIQVFGCETVLASAILSVPDVPVAVHLQGVLSEYILHFFPDGVTGKDFIGPGTFMNEAVLRNGFNHLSDDYRRRAVLEKRYLSGMKFAMGRTQWDESVTRRYSQAEYFHVDEVLRDEFYNAAGSWSRGHVKPGRVFRLLSTISETPYKGLDVIMRCADMLKKEGFGFEWQVAGVKENSNIVRIFENKYHISCKDSGIRFLGIQNPDGLVSALQTSDVYVHPSYIENSPNSVCEAQMTGIPTIAAAGGGVPTIVRDMDTGLLFPTGDHTALARIIRQLASDPDEAARLGEKGAAQASARHDKARIAADLRTAYGKILQSRSRI